MWEVIPACQKLPAGAALQHQSCPLPSQVRSLAGHGTGTTEAEFPLLKLFLATATLLLPLDLCPSHEMVLLDVNSVCFLRLHQWSLTWIQCHQDCDSLVSQQLYCRPSLVHRSQSILFCLGSPLSIFWPNSAASILGRLCQDHYIRKACQHGASLIAVCWLPTG